MPVLTRVTTSNGAAANGRREEEASRQRREWLMAVSVAVVLTPVRPAYGVVSTAIHGVAARSARQNASIAVQITSPISAHAATAAAVLPSLRLFAT